MALCMLYYPLSVTCCEAEHGFIYPANDPLSDIAGFIVHQARHDSSLLLVRKHVDINSVHTRCIVKTSGFTRAFVKIDYQI